MATRLPLRASAACPLVAAAVPSVPAQAPTTGNKPATQRRGHHPTVVVQLLIPRAGYDCAARFYPHPARLYLWPARAPTPASPAPLLEHAHADAASKQPLDAAQRHAEPR